MWRNILAAIILSGLIVWGIMDYMNNDKEAVTGNEKQNEQAEDSGDKVTGDTQSDNPEPSDTNSNKVGTKKGNIAPDFTIVDLNGKEVSLSDYRGKKVILNMWATWCPPCRAEMPEMQSYYETYAEKDNVEILAVNMTFQDSISNVKTFKEENGLTFPILLDQNNDVGVPYRVMVLPSTWFINEEGIISDIYQGPMNEETMKSLIKKMDK
jgi:peroxiredoxin